MRSRDRALAHQAASLLLQYPDEQLLQRVPMLRAVLTELPGSVAEPLGRFLDYLEATPLPESQQHYVATIDMRRRSCLYLSFWSHGDTRLRGRAILRFKEAYLAAGLDMGDEELPDHLAVVLEFAATGDQDAGLELLTENRAAIELIRSALHHVGTPYAQVIDAVCETLPPVGKDVLSKAARIAAQGPPQELVGLGGPTQTLEPYPLPGATPGSTEGIGARR